MNIYVPIDVQQRFKCLEFKGKPFKYKNRTLIRAHHYSLNEGFYYSFEEDFAWFKNSDIPEQLLSKV